uniref:Uncharacterized protein n=1 Tax=Kalanchoe fedtschenkoi TaxID=63787 RepID=A0A7N0VGN5_KALFE
MGNYASCTLMSKRATSRAVKVILPTGDLRQLKEEMKAAELMMEFPSHFLANSCSLQIGRRFSALSADEDLELGNVYLMFPMRRLSSVVKAGDLAVLFAAARMRLVVVEKEEEEEEGGDVNKRGGTGSVCNLEEVEGLFEEEFKHRLSMCRSRKPKLETIKEEAIS